MMNKWIFDFAIYVLRLHLMIERHLIPYLVNEDFRINKYQITFYKTKIQFLFILIFIEIKSIYFLSNSRQIVSNLIFIIIIII